MTELEAYAAEIGCDAMTLDQLINSHRHLRGLNIEDNQARLASLEQWRKEARDRVMQEETDRRVIKLDTLRSMTVGELVELLRAD